MSEGKAIAIVPGYQRRERAGELAEIVERDVLATAGKLPKDAEQKLIGEVRRMAAHAALAEGAASAMAAAQSHVQEVLMRERKASRERFAEVAELLSEDEKTAWQQMERESFAAGVEVAHQAVDRIAEAATAARLPEDRFSYEDWSFKDNLKDVVTFGDHRMRRRGLERFRTRRPEVEVYHPVVIQSAPDPRP